MRRRRWKKCLTEEEVSTFALKMTELSSYLLKATDHIRLSEPHSRALRHLHIAVCDATRTVTGRDVPWSSANNWKELPKVSEQSGPAPGRKSEVSN